MNELTAADPSSLRYDAARPGAEQSPRAAYLTPAQVAQELGVGHTTVEEWLKNREIEFFKKGRLVRIPRAAFEAFVRKFTLRSRTG